MMVGKKSLKQNLCLRLAGLLLVVVGGFSLNLLHRAVNLPPAHEATITEIVVAAASFLSVTSGTLLLVLGTHISDPATLSARWAEPPDGHMAFEIAPHRTHAVLASS